MHPSGSTQFDLFEIYRRFCDIRYGNLYRHEEEYSGRGDKSQTTNYSREALAQLLKLVESRLPTRESIFNELQKLMSQLNLMVDYSGFSQFYDFVFFVCRENGQKNITVNKAVAAWRIVLVGRFRLLNQWCDFVEKNQRYNLSEDTWQQVLAFSRCVHETLEGYDPEGAWPVLIDDFVEHMYRILGSSNKSNFCCSDSESHDDSFPGLKLKSLPGLKRRLADVLKIEGPESSDACFEDSAGPHYLSNSKRRRRHISHVTDGGSDESMEISRQRSPISSSSSPCAVEGCLTKGFEGLFSSRSIRTAEFRSI